LDSNLHQRLSGEGLAVVGVATGGFSETDDTLAAFLEQTAVTFPVVWDTDGSYGDWRFPDGALSPYPRQVVLGRDGVVKYLAHEHDESALAAVIEAALAE